MLTCLSCASPLDDEKLTDSGIVDCEACGDRFVSNQELTALTYVDDIPLSEYLGG